MGSKRRLNGFEQVEVVKINRNKYKGIWNRIKHQPTPPEIRLTKSYEFLKTEYLSCCVHYHMLIHFNIHSAHIFPIYFQQLRPLTLNVPAYPLYLFEI